MSVSRNGVTTEPDNELGGTGHTYGDGISFVRWWLLWLLGGVVAIVCVSVDLITRRTDNLFGRDFTNLWTAGRLVLEHAPSCPFSLYCFRVAMIQELHIATLQNYSYPPTALLIAAPFALFPYFVALALWTVLGVLFFLWAARPYLPSRFPLALSVLTPAATINIWNGHYGFLFGGLWLLFFRNLDRKPNASGIAAGLLTFKPHLGLVIAVTMLRYRRALIAAIATSAILIVLTTAIFGFDTWRAFLTATTATQSKILTRTTPQFYFMMMPSAYVVFGRSMIGVAAQITFASAAAFLLARHRRWNAFSASTATFLIIPYVFNYDMTVACLGFAILLFEKWSELGNWQRRALVLAFFSPELTYFAPILVPFVLLAALNIQLSLAAIPTEALEPAGSPSHRPQALKRERSAAFQA